MLCAVSSIGFVRSDGTICAEDYRVGMYGVNFSTFYKCLVVCVDQVG